MEQFGGSVAFRHPNGTTYQVLIHGRLAVPASGLIGSHRRWNSTYFAGSWSRSAKSRGCREFVQCFDLPLTKTGGQVDMILGLDNYDLIRGQEIRPGEADGEPVATRSKLGWFVRGPTGEPDMIGVVRSNVVVSHTLEGMFRHFTQTESYGAELKAAPGFSAAKVFAIIVRYRGGCVLTRSFVPAMLNR